MSDEYTEKLTRWLDGAEFIDLPLHRSPNLTGLIRTAIARLATLEQENERLRAGRDERDERIRRLEDAATWWAANPNEHTEEALSDLLDEDAIQRKRDETDRALLSTNEEVES